jgi:hypothetical protein
MNVQVAAVINTGIRMALKNFYEALDLAINTVTSRCVISPP